MCCIYFKFSQNYYFNLVNPSFAERRSQFAPAVSLILMAEVFSLLQIKGMEKLKFEMSDWVTSQSVASSGFMAKPADLQQQLYAQREIAIRELSLVHINFITYV